MALAGLWVVSKALIFFKTIRAGFLGLKTLFAGGLSPVTPPVPPPPPPPPPKIIPTSTSRIIPGTAPLKPISPALPKFNAAANRWMMNLPGVGNRIVAAPKLTPPVVPKTGIVKRVGEGLGKRIGRVKSAISPVTKEIVGTIKTPALIAKEIGKEVSNATKIIAKTEVGKGINTFSKGAVKGAGTIFKTAGTGGLLSGLFGFAMGFAKKKGEGGTTGEAVGAGSVRGGAGLAGSAAGAALGTLIAPGIGTVIGGMIGGFAGDALGGWINKNAPGVAKKFGTVWDNMITKLSGAFGAVKDMFKIWGDILRSAATSVDNFLKPIGGLETLAEILGDTLLIPVRVITTAFGFLADIIKGIAQIFSGKWKEGFKTLGIGIVDLIKGLFDAIFAPLITLFNKYFGTKEEIQKANKEEAANAISKGKKLIGTEEYNKLVEKNKDIGILKNLGDNLVYLIKNPLAGAEQRKTELGIYQQQRAEVAAFDQARVLSTQRTQQANLTKGPVPNNYYPVSQFYQGTRSSYQPTPQPIRKMAEGGVVTRSGMAEVHQGELYAGRNTRDSFLLMVAASQRQLNALMVLEKALIDVKDEVKNQANRPPPPIIMTLDGQKITKTISSRPEMQIGLGKSRVMLP
jgi:hypothetical protein